MCYPLHYVYTWTHVHRSQITSIGNILLLTECLQDCRDLKQEICSCWYEDINCQDMTGNRNAGYDGKMHSFNTYVN